MQANKMILGLALSFSLNAIASDINFGEISNGGTGCPSSEVLHLSLTKKRLAIYPQNLFVGAGAPGERKLNRSNCNIAVPFELAPGKALEIVSHLHAGQLYLDDGANLRVTQEVFFAGSQSPVMSINESSTEVSYGPYHQKEYLHLTSSCGASGILRINSTLLARAGVNSGEVYASKEKIGLEYRIVDCQ